MINKDETHNEEVHAVLCCVFPGAVDAATTMVRTEGVISLYKGLALNCAHLKSPKSDQIAAPQSLCMCSQCQLVVDHQLLHVLLYVSRCC
jgi:hypothetical protein